MLREWTFGKLILYFLQSMYEDMIHNDAWFTLASNSIVVVETHKLKLADLTKLKHRFVLVTANNFDMPSGGKDSAAHETLSTQILGLPHLVAWYGTFPSIVHPKFHPLPLGSKMTWKSPVINGEDNARQMFMLYRAIGERQHALASAGRTRLLYANFAAESTRHPRIAEHKDTRYKLQAALQRHSLLEPTPKVRPRMYMQQLGDSVFCVSPPGNGVDSHRTWEAILMRCIPIVLSYAPLDPLYEDLPVVVVRDWDEITAEFLDKKLQYFRALSEADYSGYGKLRFSFWKNAIQQSLQAGE
jgi:hypothetical protein